MKSELSEEAVIAQLTLMGVTWVSREILSQMKLGNYSIRYTEMAFFLVKSHCKGNPTFARSSSQRIKYEIFKQDADTIKTRGSGNYASEETKEITRLKRELRDKEDALEILKKAISILGN